MSQNNVQNPLKNVSTRALVKELMTRNGVKHELKNDTYVIKVIKREVEI